MDRRGSDRGQCVRVHVAVTSQWHKILNRKRSLVTEAVLSDSRSSTVDTGRTLFLKTDLVRRVSCPPVVILRL